MSGKKISRTFQGNIKRYVDVGARTKMDKFPSSSLLPFSRRFKGKTGKRKVGGKIWKLLPPPLPLHPSLPWISFPPHFRKRKPPPLTASIHQLGTTVLFVRGRRRRKGRRWENCFLNPPSLSKLLFSSPFFNAWLQSCLAPYPRKKGAQRRKGGETKQKQQQQQQRQNGISFMTLQLLERKRKQELSV